MLTVKRLKELLKYDPHTGVFIWLIQTNRSQTKPGDRAGRVNATTGRCEIGVDGKRYISARLAWFYMTGRWPVGEVDHADTNPLNDRWKNLRLATRGQNEANKGLSRRNTSGMKGVSWDRNRQKWKAQIAANGKNRLIGRFETPDAAQAAYARELISLHGKFARVL